MNKRTLTFKEKLQAVGPGAMITAAFVGPGTVATCTTAGMNFGYALLWAVTFSVCATIIFQLMTARLALVGKKDLVTAISEVSDNPLVIGLLKIFLVVTVLVACFAFQAGNLSGASVGLSALTGMGQAGSATTLGLITLAVVLMGTYKRIEKIMVFFVLVMSVSFLLTVFAVSPNLLEVLKGAFIPSIPEGSLLTVIALIGTTIVPMNLLLHSIIVRERWQQPENLLEAKYDSFISISVGGIITAAIIITAGTVLYKTSTADAVTHFHLQLEPLLGKWAKWVGGIGLMVAGVSSAIAVPITAGYVMSRVYNWESQFDNNKFRLLTVIIIVFGTVLAALNKRPTEVIILAQAINGMFLPFVAVFIMYTMNSKKVLGAATNSATANILGAIATLVAIFLGVRGTYAAGSKILQWFM